MEIHQLAMIVWPLDDVTRLSFICYVSMCNSERLILNLLRTLKKADLSRCLAVIKHLTDKLVSRTLPRKLSSSHKD